MKALFIAEKPSVQRNVQHFYEKHRDEFEDEIDFTAMAGHIVELFSPGDYDEAYKKWDVDVLPINPAKEGGWKYRVSASKTDMYNKIKSLVRSGDYDYIIHGGDSDAEGELLVNLALNHMKNDLPVKRYWDNGTDETHVMQALHHLEDDSDEKYVNLYHGALLRQREDWLFGMNGSRAVADKIQTSFGDKIATGRVMTWVQAQIVRREDEINAFVPSTEYGVRIILSKDGKEFSADLCDESQQLIYFKTEDEAKKIANAINDQAKVLSCEVSQGKTQPPKLFQLATLQTYMSKYSITAAQTLAIVQSLYEKQILTYPRTDCEHMSSGEDFAGILNSCTVVEKAKPFINTAKSHIDAYKKNKNYVNDNEITKHGHTALVPTTKVPQLSSLSPAEQKVYEVVATRYVASMLDPMVYTKTKVVLQDQEYLFFTAGKIILSQGFNELLKKSSKELELPALNQNDIVPINEHNVTEKTTKCPSRYTDGSLISLMNAPAKYIEDETLAKKMRNLTIGTPATRSPIFEKLIKDKYIKRDKSGYFYPTEFGAAMIHAMNHLALCQTEMTAHWDEKLQDVKTGLLSIDEAEEYFNNQLNTLINDIKAMPSVTRASNKRSIGTCACGGNIIATQRAYLCESCKLWMPKANEKQKFSFNDEEALALFNNKKVEKTIHPKPSMAFPKAFFLDKTAEFPLQNEDVAEELNAKCPLCGKPLQRYKFDATCSCGYSIGTWIAGKQLSNKELEELFTKGRTSKKVDKLYSKKSNKYFSAYLKLVDNTISMDFTK